MTPRKIAVGDRIKFKAATRASYRTVWRKVRNIDDQGRPMVGYEGWSNFIVHWREILEIERG